MSGKPTGLSRAEKPGAELSEAVHCQEFLWPGRNYRDAMPKLSPDKIHLWTLDLSNGTSDRLDPWILPAEKARASKIRNVNKRSLYLGGRAGLRLLLSAYTGIENEALRFSYGSRGKPRLENLIAGSELTFNYTLSGDKVLYALSLDRSVGVDMEVLPRKVNAELMARKSLSNDEFDAWQDLPRDLRNDGMLCCWTRKEAYGKTIGVGIRYYLSKVSMFRQLNQSDWQTELSGLFDDTEAKGMPVMMGGVQLQMPFEAVATLMYQNEVDTSPDIFTAQLLIAT